MIDIKSRLQQIREKIRDALERSGSKESVRIVAVSKMKPVSVIQEAISCGIYDIGENRVQEAIPKIEQLGRGKIIWHLVGHLQSNKAKKTVQYFDIIQSIDSLKIAKKVSEYSKELNKRLPVLVEVNISGESTKFGIDPEEVIDFIYKISELDGIVVKGLMTIGPLTDNKRKIRQAFRLMYKIYNNVKESKIPKTEIDTLSMGMSDDFEIAVEEGSNMVRIGRALFGERN
ncbi:MAG: YggS family pyridoxal phosphate-dependent enzyme [Candidatus Marinimicrobia bacterium]|nr:YggS family pyridoxal phosphate-dependent enzyme [Candidatus Neomarinimicrobiota bacterium]